MAAIDTSQRDAPSIALPGLGRALVAAGKLGQKSAEDIYRKAVSGKNSFIAELVGSGAVSASDLAHTLFHEIEMLERIKAAPDSLAKGVDLFPLYGVTPGNAGVLLAMRGTTVLVCGDAVPTQEHLEQGQVLSPCHDLVQARESFAEAIEIADFLVAGRDNMLINQTRRPF